MSVTTTTPDLSIACVSCRRLLLPWRTQIEVLSKAGLTLGEARTALMASPQSFLIDETELQSGVDTLRDVLALNLGDIAKVCPHLVSHDTR